MSAFPPSLHMRGHIITRVGGCEAVVGGNVCPGVAPDMGVSGPLPPTGSQPVPLLAKQWLRFFLVTRVSSLSHPVGRENVSSLITDHLTAVDQVRIGPSFT